MDESHDSLAAVIEASATIKKPAFKITVGVCFGLALLSVVARAVIRLRTRRQLSLDDYLIFLAAAFLSAATGLMYHLCDEFYLSTAIQKDMSIVFRLDLQQFNAIVINAVQENATFLIIAWTTTFFVKFSFLAFFKGLIRLVDRIKYYYWTVVVFTVVSWMFLVSEPFILCSDFGYASLSCFDHSKDILYISMTGLVTGLDALSDILIATIPIIIIHRARLRTMQKISLGMFLCLNLVMVCLAITRVSKIHGAAGVDVPWEFFWQYIEAAVAVMMGSLTVVRSLFALRDERNRARVAVARPRPLAQSFFNRVRLLHNNKEHVGLESHDNDALPEVPSATMMGLRTFIRRNNRDSGSQMTQVPLEGISQQDTVVELDNYNSRQDAVAELDNPQGYPVAELDSARPTVMYEQPRFDSNRRVHE